MQKPTLFDVINDRLIIDINCCGSCEAPLYLDQTKEIFFEVYQGQHGHLVFWGCHRDCLIDRLQFYQNFFGPNVDTTN